MNRTVLILTSTWVMAAACVHPRGATTGNDRALLIGTWELVSFTSRLSDGRVVSPWGQRPVGQLTYDAAGRMIALLMHQARNEAGGNASDPAVQGEYSAYFGTYTVDAERRVVTHRVNGSLAATRASSELLRNYEFRDGLLVLTFTRSRGAAPVTNTLVWRRAVGASP